MRPSNPQHHDGPRGLNWAYGVPFTSKPFIYTYIYPTETLGFNTLHFQNPSCIPSQLSFWQCKHARKNKAGCSKTTLIPNCWEARSSSCFHTRPLGQPTQYQSWVQACFFLAFKAFHVRIAAETSTFSCCSPSLRWLSPSFYSQIIIAKALNEK